MDTPQEYFDICIVSPEKNVLTAKAKQALVPCADGYMGVLPGHAPIIATLQKMALLSVYEETLDSPSRRFVVSSGFVEILPYRTTVLADRATDLNGVTPESLEKDVAALEKKTDAPDATQEILYLRALQDVIRAEKLAA
ncbi:MAG: F0F1 ATP synthase subunit epsilon [Rickettsiales bacterium]